MKNGFLYWWAGPAGDHAVTDWWPNLGRPKDPHGSLMVTGWGSGHPDVSRGRDGNSAGLVYGQAAQQQ